MPQVVAGAFGGRARIAAMSHFASPVPGLPDDAFAHDGLITRRVLRAAALAHLRPAPGELLWDLGVGAGSVLVEWLRALPDTRAVGVERRDDRLANARTNVERFGVASRATLVAGDVADEVASLPRPDAVFIGGGLSSGVLDACVSRLPDGGRFVAHGVTVEAEVALADAHARHGGELTRISVELGDAIGSFRGWQPLRAVTQWALTR